MKKLRPHLQQATKEPFLQFLAMGALLFVIYGWANAGQKDPRGKQIIIGEGERDRLSSVWQQQWNRQPTESEIQALLDQYIREEIYYREALAMRLDHNDQVIRRRLAQKMEFLAKDLADMTQPEEEDLARFFKEHQEDYLQAPQITFSHIYFSPDKRTHPEMDARQMLAQITDQLAEQLNNKGDRFSFQTHYANRKPLEISQLMGSAFAKTLFELGETGKWLGPIQSGYGYHLVCIHQLKEAYLPDWKSVEDQLKVDYRYQQQKSLNKGLYEKLKTQYEIVYQ